MEIWYLLETVIDDPARLAPPIAACSVVMTITALFWPMIDRRKQKVRLRHVFGAETRMKRRAGSERRDRQRDDIVKLRHARPRRLYLAIVERLRLDNVLANPRTRMLVYQAGFRSPAAAIKITAMRAILAATFGLVVAVYLPVVLKLDVPVALLALIVLGAILIGWFAPIVFLKNRLDKRRTEVRRNWPDAMDLLLICVESGMSIEAAFRKVAEEIAAQSSVLSEEMMLTTAELNYLPDRQTAYRRLGARTDVEEVRSIVTSLIQSEKYGTSVGQALRVLSQESRSLRMAAAEKKAAALPPKLTVPMILFFLPVLFAVIMTPAIIQIMQD